MFCLKIYTYWYIRYDYLWTQFIPFISLTKILNCSAFIIEDIFFFFFSFYSRISPLFYLDNFFSFLLLHN